MDKHMVLYFKRKKKDRKKQRKLHIEFETDCVIDRMLLRKRSIEILLKTRTDQF